METIIPSIETMMSRSVVDLAKDDRFLAHPNNPKPVSREDFKQLYLKAL